MMARQFWNDFGPSLLLAGGIVAGQAAQEAWCDLAGTSVLAVGVLAADALAARLRGQPATPSLPAWILAGTFALLGCLALLRAPGHTGSLIPLLGLGAWTVFFMPNRNRRMPGKSACSRC